MKGEGIKSIQQLLCEDDNISNDLKKAMSFANLSLQDLQEIARLSGAKTKQDLLCEVEQTIFDGGVK